MRCRFFHFVFPLNIITCLACHKNENFSSRITLLNAVVGTPGPKLTFKVDSMPVVSGLAYDSLVASSVVPSGTSSIGLLVGSMATTPIVTNLQSGEAYTGVLYDSIQRIVFFLRKDALPAVPGSGRCYIRIYNLITSSPGLYLADSQRVTTNARESFGDFASSRSSPAFTEIDTVRHPVMRTDSTHAIDSLPFPFRSGKIYTVFLTGSIQDTGRRSTGAFKPKMIVQVHN